MYRKKITEDSKEPVNQMGLNFDTEVKGNPLGEDLYAVAKTNPKCWAMDSKAFLRCLKDKKGDQVCDDFLVIKLVIN